jgi:putative ABC transport system ATP-binding protein
MVALNSNSNPRSNRFMLGENSILSVSNLCKHVDSGDTELTILQNINLDVTKGEALAIIGVSGSGKTTLLSLLAGIDLPSSGLIRFQGHELTVLNEDERATLRASQVGFIFQSFQLMPTLSALENVMLPLELQYQQNPRTVARHWLCKVGLEKRLNHYPRQLSGGEQQRVAIARAFAINPVLLFADEPTGNLDKKSAKMVIELLFNLNHELQTTLIIVTHDEQLAKSCQRKLVLDGGSLQ